MTNQSNRHAQGYSNCFPVKCKFSKQHRHVGTQYFSTKGIVKKGQTNVLLGIIANNICASGVSWVNVKRNKSWEIMREKRMVFPRSVPLEARSYYE